MSEVVLRHISSKSEDQVGSRSTLAGAQIHQKALTIGGSGGSSRAHESCSASERRKMSTVVALQTRQLMRLL